MTHVRTAAPKEYKKNAGVKRLQTHVAYLKRSERAQTHTQVRTKCAPEYVLRFNLLYLDVESDGRDGIDRMAAGKHCQTRAEHGGTLNKQHKQHKQQERGGERAGRGRGDKEGIVGESALVNVEACAGGSRGVASSPLILDRRNVARSLRRGMDGEGSRSIPCWSQLRESWGGKSTLSVVTAMKRLVVGPRPPLVAPAALQSPHYNILVRHACLRVTCRPRANVHA